MNNNRYKMKDVRFIKGHEYCLGEERSFWRADLNGQTISSLCRTKKECIEEAREELKRMNGR